MSAREREVVMVVPVGTAGAILAFLALIVVIAVGALLLVGAAYPNTEYSTVPSTRTPGPCAPFCLRPTTTQAPGGAR
ncbi:hypothetical protein [Nocardia goodfellowii]|uniref:Uncharacterized protein n=1 Tax=Nocardia goodfellowii TaxID=882446 RepID=A0ABS4QS61_9NOCA|nr:hypothetical protein [Nocardia goodfellowii]MBP2194547.1 hypothetical protein [Nocardia goodfellowii]